MYCVGGEAGVETLGKWNEATPGLPGYTSLFRGIIGDAIASFYILSACCPTLL